MAEIHLAAATRLFKQTEPVLRVHETLRVTPAMQLGVADHIWSIGELMDAALVSPKEPTETAPDRRGRFRVIKGAYRKSYFSSRRQATTSSVGASPLTCLRGSPKTLSRSPVR
jgi:hypothetical protein